MVFDLSSKDLEYVDYNLRSILEEGVFLFAAGPHTDCRVTPEKCASLTVTLSEEYQPACQVRKAVTHAFVVHA